MKPKSDPNSKLLINATHKTLYNYLNVFLLTILWEWQFKPTFFPHCITQLWMINLALYIEYVGGEYTD